MQNVLTILLIATVNPLHEPDIIVWYVKWLQVCHTSDQSSAPYMYVHTCTPYIKQVYVYQPVLTSNPSSACLATLSPLQEEPIRMQ